MTTKAKRPTLDPKFLTPEFNQGLSIKTGQTVTVQGHDYTVERVSRRAEFEKSGIVTLIIRKAHGVPTYSVKVTPAGGFQQLTKLF